MPRRAKTLVLAVTDAAGADGAGHLRHAERTDIDRIRHRLFHRFGNGGRLDRKIRIHQTYGRKIALRELGVLNQVAHDGPEARIGDRRLLGLKHRERFAGLEMLSGDVGATDIENCHQRQDRRDVEHRQR